MVLLNIIFFAVALNVDALSVGISYGIKRIKVPLYSILIISCISMVAVLLSMTAGRLITNYLPAITTQRIGGSIMILLGIWNFYQYLKTRNNSEHEEQDLTVKNESKELEPLSLLKINVFGLIIHILKKPCKADLDMSGVITYGEAFLLGIALSMDSIAAGLAVSLLGYSMIITTVFVGANYILFTYLGLYAGRKISCSSIGKYLQILPGIILMSLGLIKIGIF